MDMNLRSRARRYILNSAVITASGTYTYRKVSVTGAQDWIARGPFESAIGYEETAEIASEVLEVRVSMNRTTIRMEAGDEALVFRLALPPGERRIDPALKGKARRQYIVQHLEIGILERTA